MVWLLAAFTLPGTASAADLAYQVQAGDNLWSIAERYLHHPSQAHALMHVNRIAEPHRIRPGTRLRIPAAWLRLQTQGVRIAALRGEVGLRIGQAAERTPSANEWLQAPAVLRTGASGSASLAFADGSRLLLLHASELSLRQAATTALGQQRLITLELLRGGLESEVQPTGASGRFEIHTPAATAAVRGTDFRIHLQGGTLRTEVLRGAVSVHNAQGDVLVGTEQGTLAQAGSAPEPAVGLLLPPDLSGLPERIDRLSIDLPLPALAGAVGYRSQWVADTVFKLAVSDTTDAQPRVHTGDLPDGHYLLRVRGVDARGLEGRTAERMLQIHARPEPPLLIEPGPGQATSAARPLFRWTSGTASGGYRLQIFANGETRPSIDITTDQPSAQPESALPPGAYRWRVAAVDVARGPGPWTDTQFLRRLPDAPSAPAPPAGELVQAGPVLQWRAVPQAAAYRVQIAAQDDFATPLLDQQTTGPRLDLPTLAPGRYQVRVQALDAGGQAGAWGAAQTFDIAAPPSPRWPALLLLLPLLLL